MAYRSRRTNTQIKDDAERLLSLMKADYRRAQRSGRPYRGQSIKFWIEQMGWPDVPSSRYRMQTTFARIRNYDDFEDIVVRTHVMDLSSGYRLVHGYGYSEDPADILRYVEGRERLVRGHVENLLLYVVKTEAKHGSTPLLAATRGGLKAILAIFEATGIK